ncbi:MAG: hypothetical protein HGA96_02550 [Desulfobulbaceae bacterium]|nr:hypothetical protein [Desulfobulbaceae bacterium]
MTGWITRIDAQWKHPAQCASLIDALHNCSRLRVTSSGLDLALVAQLWPTQISDYGDAVIAALSKKTRDAAVATFDRKLIKELIAAGIAVSE